MAGFIKGAKIWNRIEKKYIITDTAERDTGLCGAFPRGVLLKFILEERISAHSAKLVVFSDLDGRCMEYPMKKDEGGFFFALISMSDISENGGLFFYEYMLETEYGEFFVARETTDFSDKITDKKPRGDELFQLLIYEKRETYPEFFRGGIAYQIFVDRFCRAGNEPPREDAVMNYDWYGGVASYYRPGDRNFKNNMFFGGDLPGVEKKLGYIASLGVTTIYLNPIFTSASNHKYDTGDYMSVDSMFGGDEAFLSFVKSAKNYGIEVILDGVFNHTGDDSIYFNKYGHYDSLGAYQSKDSPYAEWYNFTHFPDRYESWWGFSTLPRVMSDTPSYKEFLFGENGVIRKYIREGICGWRLDVADELSDGFLEELAAAAKEERKDAIIIGEVWEDASNKVSYSKRRSYFSGRELDSVMNYPMREAIIAYIRKGDYKKFIRTANSLYYNYPREVTHQLLNILGTHDTERIITMLAGADSTGLSPDMLAEKRMSAEEYALGEKRLELSYFILATLPGVPCIYYGDEIGMEGERDPFNRRPYPWGRENMRLLSFYRKVGEMRRREELFFDAEFELKFIDKEILVYERFKDDMTLIVVVNRSEKDYTFSASSTVSEIFALETADRFVIKSMKAACFKAPRETHYAVLPTVGN